MSRVSAYGSLEGDAAGVRRGTPSFASRRSPFDHAAGHAVPVPPPPSGGSSARFSWWRAGIIVAAAATALSATVGLVHLASFSGIAQPPVRSGTMRPAEGAPEFSEQLEAQSTTRQGKPDQAAASAASGADGTQQVHTAPSNEPRVAATAATPGVDTDLPSLSFVALNEYTRRGDVVGVGYPWLQGKILVEPHRETSLEVVSPIEGMSYYWSIVETSNTDISLGEFFGDKVEVTFRVAPEYTVVLLEKDAQDGSLSRMVEVDIFCKYVRRELRTLTDSERNEMFDAMKVRMVKQAVVLVRLSID